MFFFIAVARNETKYMIVGQKGGETMAGRPRKYEEVDAEQLMTEMVSTACNLFGLRMMIGRRTIFLESLLEKLDVL